MRNLELLESVTLSDASLVGCSHITVDYDTKLVFCATTTKIVGLDPISRQVVCDVLLPTDATTTVINVQHLYDRMAVCAVMSSGDIFLWTTATNDVECVGSVSCGIKAATWSPDLDILVLLTGEDQIVLMTRDFDPLSEVSLHLSGSGEAELVNVGWGKKETQFHGSEGKMAAQSAAQKTNLVPCASPSDDRKPQISWRADGQYFTVSYINPLTGGRELKVWTRDCVLHSTSEPVVGLGQTVAYKPSGGLIASTLFKRDSQFVAFFEKNGLRKNNVDFELYPQLKDIKVVDLLWNLESTILAVWCEQLPPGGAAEQSFRAQSYLLLYTMSNYHWYLKQCLEFTPNDRLSAVLWDSELAYRLHIVLDTGRYLQYTWTWSTNHSAGFTSHDQAVVAVIDADRVLLTPFRLMVVPPPMCAYYLQMAAPVTLVAFCHTPSRSNDFAVLLANGQIAFYTFEQQADEAVVDETVKVAAAGGSGFTQSCQLPSCKAVVSFDAETAKFPLCIHHLLWTDMNEIIYCRILESGTTVCLATVDWQRTAITDRCCVELEAGTSVVAVAHNTESHTTAVETNHGQVYSVDAECGLLKPWLVSSSVSGLRLPQVCQQIALCKLAQQEVVLGLTERFRFYVNETEVASNVTSFTVHSEFLLLTTHSHTCRSISRHIAPSVLPTLLGGSLPNDETLRQIERGARIVCTVSADTKLILQMPRGNLETIHPRALVLAAARHHLDQLDFRAAFDLMKKHRINMNLIHDHCPETFLANTDIFVRQLDLPANINLFLTDLCKEDVCKTMYLGGYNTASGDGYTAVTGGYNVNIVQQVTASTNVNKVDVVCDKVRKSLEECDADKYLLCVLTTHVRKTIPELELALQRIKTLKDKKCSALTADEALRYLLYLVDVNELYNVALGTYDFGLVLMVAEKSQKDPKEYLPQLNELRQQEVNYQRYLIDVQLRRFDRALGHLTKCGVERFSECLTFVRQHELYSLAVTLYTVGSPEHTQISTVYGEHLMETKRYNEAGLILSRVGQYERALEAFEACLEWRRALMMASQLNYSAQQTNELARRLARKLVDTRQHAAAACVLTDYADDIEEAITTLIAGSQWDEALRLIYLHHRTDFIETDLKPALIESHGHQVELLASSMRQFVQHCSRLKIVREQKQQMATLELLEGGGDGQVGGGNTDLFSDTSSVADSEVSFASSTKSSDSRASRTSSRSTRSRQKKDRKRWSLKEGSPYEEFALVDALHALVMQAEQSKAEICCLMRALVTFHHDSLAAQLQTQLDQLLKSVNDSFVEIWSPVAAADNPVIGPESSVNSILGRRRDRTLQNTAENTDKNTLRPPPVVFNDSTWRLPIVDNIK